MTDAKLIKKQKRKRSKEQEEKTLQTLVKKHTKKRKSNKSFEDRLPKNLGLNYKETHGGLLMVQMFEFSNLNFPKEVILIMLEYLQDMHPLEEFLASPYFTYDITKQPGDRMTMFTVKRMWRQFLYITNRIDRPHQSVSKGPFALHSIANKKILSKYGLDCTRVHMTGLLHKNQPTLMQHFDPVV